MMMMIKWFHTHATQSQFLVEVPTISSPKTALRSCLRVPHTSAYIMDLGFVKDGDSTLMFTLTPPQTKDAGIEVSKGCYCFVIDISGRWASTLLLRAWPPWPRGPPLELSPPTAANTDTLASPRVWPCTA